MEVQLYSFTASALDGGEQSASPPVRFTHDDTHSDIRWTEGWVELRASREALEERKIPGPYREQNHDFLQVQPRRVLNYVHKTTCKLVKNRVIYQCNFRLWCRNICCYTYVHHARADVKLHKHASTHAHTYKILFVRTVSCDVLTLPLALRRNIISLQVSANSRNLRGLEKWTMHDIAHSFVLQNVVAVQTS